MRKLKTMIPKTRKKVLGKAARTAMKPVLAQARANIPVKSGQMRKATKLYALKKNRRGNIGVRISCGEKQFTGDQYYGSFQEFGWHPGRRTTKTVTDSREWREGGHFVQEAYESGGERALQTFMAEVPREIEKMMAQGGK